MSTNQYTRLSHLKLILHYENKIENLSFLRVRI